jgi:hypothetical protein
MVLKCGVLPVRACVRAECLIEGKCLSRHMRQTLREEEGGLRARQCALMQLPKSSANPNRL